MHGKKLNASIARALEESFKKGVHLGKRQEKKETYELQEAVDAIVEEFKDTFNRDLNIKVGFDAISYSNHGLDDFDLSVLCEIVERIAKARPSIAAGIVDELIPEIVDREGFEYHLGYFEAILFLQDGTTWRRY